MTQLHHSKTVKYRRTRTQKANIQTLHAHKRSVQHPITAAARKVWSNTRRANSSRTCSNRASAHSFQSSSQSYNFQTCQRSTAVVSRAISLHCMCTVPHQAWPKLSFWESSKQVTFFRCAWAGKAAGVGSSVEILLQQLLWLDLGNNFKCRGENGQSIPVCSWRSSQMWFFMRLGRVHMLLTFLTLGATLWYPRQVPALLYPQATKSL